MGVLHFSSIRPDQQVRGVALRQATDEKHKTNRRRVNTSVVTADTQFSPETSEGLRILTMVRYRFVGCRGEVVLGVGPRKHSSRILRT